MGREAAQLAVMIAETASTIRVEVLMGVMSLSCAKSGGDACGVNLGPQLMMRLHSGALGAFALLLQSAGQQVVFGPVGARLGRGQTARLQPQGIPSQARCRTQSDQSDQPHDRQPAPDDPG